MDKENLVEFKLGNPEIEVFKCGEYAFPMYVITTMKYNEHALIYSVYEVMGTDFEYKIAQCNLYMEAFIKHTGCFELSITDSDAFIHVCDFKYHLMLMNRLYTKAREDLLDHDWKWKGIEASCFKE